MRATFVLLAAALLVPLGILILLVFVSEPATSDPPEAVGVLVVLLSVFGLLLTAVMRFVGVRTQAGGRWFDVLLSVVLASFALIALGPLLPEWARNVRLAAALALSSLGLLILLGSLSGLRSRAWPPAVSVLGLAAGVALFVILIALLGAPPRITRLAPLFIPPLAVSAWLVALIGRPVMTAAVVAYMAASAVRFATLPSEVDWRSRLYSAQEAIRRLEATAAQLEVFREKYAHLETNWSQMRCRIPASMDLDSFENGLRTALANEKAGSVEIRRVGGAELYRGLSAQDVEVVAPAGALSRALARQCRYVRIAGREPLGARARARLRVFSKASGAASRAAPIRGSEAIPFPGLVFDPLSWISVARLHDLQRMQNIANRRLGELEVIKRQVDAFQSMERSVYELKDSLESVKLPGTADLKVVALIPGDAWTARIRRDDNLSGDPDSLSAGSRLHDGVVKSIEGDHLAVEVEVPVYGKAPVKRLLRFAPPAPALPRITVAADTTRLTSPLLADGTPDYVRWLNLKAGCLALAIPCAPGAP